MARPRSEKTLLIKEKLIARLRDGFHPPGQRFFSNRGLAAHFDVSYQTAHRLICELVDEGWLERRPSAGTYVAGPANTWRGVALVFHHRARRQGSFGDRLLKELHRALNHAGIRAKTLWAQDDRTLIPDKSWLPVLWECPQTMTALVQAQRFLLVLNDTPPPGLASSFVDSVACDDFSGGAAAAELLRRIAPPRKLAILAGPKDDHRSRDRVAGFHSVSPKSDTFWSNSWYAESAHPLAKRIAKHNYSGVFCGNDRLAEALVQTGTTASIVGFDDAPIAESLNLTTIAIPWKEMAAAAVDIIRQRLNGNTGAAAKRLFAPRPVMRASNS